MMSKIRRKRFTLAEARTTGEKLGIDWEKFDVKQFLLGMNAELEDGAYNSITHLASDDPILIGKIVRAHLNEAPDYYKRWAQMEKAAKREHSGKNTNTEIVCPGGESAPDVAE